MKWGVWISGKIYTTGWLSQKKVVGKVPNQNTYQTLKIGLFSTAQRRFENSHLIIQKKKHFFFKWKSTGNSNCEKSMKAITNLRPPMESLPGL